MNVPFLQRIYPYFPLFSDAEDAKKEDGENPEGETKAEAGETSTSSPSTAPVPNAASKKKDMDSNFKRILLNQCQSSFEKYLQPPEGFEGLSGPDLYEAQVRYKTKLLGNIKLIGELVRYKMIASRIAVCICSDLLSRAGDGTTVACVVNERLETLAAFLESVGKMLDNRSWQYYAHFAQVMENVQQLSKSKELPARIRCLLQVRHFAGNLSPIRGETKITS